MGVVFGLADRIAVLVYGEVIATDTPEASPRQRARCRRPTSARCWRACERTQETAADAERRNLHAYYGKSHVLHGVQLQVGQGEIVACWAATASGRSTTVKAVMGQVNGTGSVHVQRAARCSA